jgi:AraC family transcriptional regulator
MKPSTCPAAGATTVRTLDLPCHRLIEATYGAGTGLPPHAHVTTSWAFVVSGDFGSTTSTGLRRYSVNELGLLRAGMIHTNQYGSSGARCLIVENIRVDDATHRVAATLSEAGHYPVYSAPATIARRVYREFAVGDTAADLVIDGLLAAMVAYAIRMNSQSLQSEIGLISDPATNEPWLGRVRDLLHAEFRSKLRMRVLADVAGVHEVHLARAFKRKYGCSPMYYVRRLRFAWAREQLTRTDRPISEIAIEAGFSDQSHFGRHFRNQTGFTPAIYRTAKRRPS